MPNMSASDLAGRHLEQVRRRREWTRKELADRCAATGAPHITAAVITDLETRRRSTRRITVDELLVLAHVLEVPPLLLIVPLDDAEVLEVAPGTELDALDAAGWLTDDDAAMGPVNEYLRPSVRQERRARLCQGTSPLTLLRQIRVVARAIKTRYKLLSSETYRERHPGSATYERNAVLLYSARLLELLNWFESLGYTAPYLPEVAAILQEMAPDLEGTQEEDMRGMDTEPPGISNARGVLARSMYIDMSAAGGPKLDPAAPADPPLMTFDPAIDAEDEDEEESEVPGDGPRA